MQLVSQRTGHVADGVPHDCSTVARHCHDDAVRAVLAGADEIWTGRYPGGTVSLHYRPSLGYLLQVDNVRADAQAAWASWDHDALIEAFVRFARELR